VYPDCRQMDSVKSGLAFAAGEVALMVNWFGFGAMCETIADSRVKGRVDIAAIPHAEGSARVSLNIYWLLSIAAGSPHQDVAYRFLRHCVSGPMDKLLTLEGAIGCRKSTWSDPEVNRLIPFYNRLEHLHGGAREMPILSRWPLIASLIDKLVLDSIDTQEPVDRLVREADIAARRLLKAAGTGN
jgi:multiple sugar transport system substrate-binding protein